MTGHKGSVLNRLSNAETARLGHWLLSNIKRLKEENHKYAAAAKQATDELGFSVSIYNLRALTKGMALDWKGDAKKHSTGIYRKSWERLAKLEETIEALKHDRYAIQATELVNRLTRVENDSAAMLELLSKQFETLRADIDHLKTVVAGMQRNQGPFGELRDLVHHLYRTLGESPPQGYNIPGAPVNGKKVPEPLRGGLGH